MVGTIAGVLLATVLNNSGGAWDNAKKYIESGKLKDDAGNVLGKGTDAHAAAVVGDTVGDPFKDTAGPSLHVLVKLLARSRWCSRRSSSADPGYLIGRGRTRRPGPTADRTLPTRLRSDRPLTRAAASHGGTSSRWTPSSRRSSWGSSRV